MATSGIWRVHRALGPPDFAESWRGSSVSLGLSQDRLRIRLVQMSSQRCLELLRSSVRHMARVGESQLVLELCSGTRLILEAADPQAAALWYHRLAPSAESVLAPAPFSRRPLTGRPVHTHYCGALIAIEQPSGSTVQIYDQAGAAHGPEFRLPTPLEPDVVLGLSGCTRFLCVAGGDALRVFQGGPSGTVLRLQVPLSGCAVSSLAAQSVGLRCRVLVAVGSRVHLLEILEGTESPIRLDLSSELVGSFGRDENAERERSLSVLTVHDHTKGVEWYCQRGLAAQDCVEAAIKGDVTGAPGTTVDWCLIPGPAQAANRIISVSSAGTVHYTEHGRMPMCRLMPRIQGLVVTAAALSPAGHTLLLGLWSASSGSEARLLALPCLGLVQTVRYVTGPDRLNWLSFSVCGGYAVAGTSSGSVLGLTQPQLPRHGENAQLYLPSEVAVVQVCCGNNDWVVCGGLSVDATEFWWVVATASGGYSLWAARKTGPLLRQRMHSSKLDKANVAFCLGNHMELVSTGREDFMELRDVRPDSSSVRIGQVFAVSPGTCVCGLLECELSIRLAVCFAAARGDSTSLEALLWKDKCEAEAVVDLKFQGPCTRFHKGYGALHWAAENGHVAALELLLAAHHAWKGAHGKQRTTSLTSGLHSQSGLSTLSAHGHLPIEVSNTVYANGAASGDIPLEICQRLLWEAARLGDVQAVLRSVQYCENPAARTSRFNVFLKSGRASTFKRDCLNWPNPVFENMTALHVACEKLSLGVMGILLREGAFPHARDNLQRLPIHLVFKNPTTASHRRRVLDEYLHYAGGFATLLIPDTNGESVMYHAMMCGHVGEALPYSVGLERAEKNEPTRRADALALSHHVGMNNANDDSLIPRDARFIIALSGYCVDVVLDITLAVELLADGQTAYFILTVAFLLFAAAVQTAWDTFNAQHIRQVFINAVLNFCLVRVPWNLCIIWFQVPDRIADKAKP